MPVARAPRSKRDIAVNLNLCIEHGFQHLLGKGRREAERPAAACPAAKRIAARVVVSHRGDETDAEADRGQRRGHRGGGQDDAAAGQAAPELVARPGQPAADRPGRPL